MHQTCFNLFQTMNTRLDQLVEIKSAVSCLCMKTSFTKYIPLVPCSLLHNQLGLKYVDTIFSGMPQWAPRNSCPCWGFLTTFKVLLLLLVKVI